MKENLGQESVKNGFYLSSAKLEQLLLISLEKWQFFFQVLTLLSTCPFLESGFPTYTRFKFLKWEIIGLFTEKIFHNVTFKIANLVAIWTISIFGTSPLRSYYGNQVNTM